MFTMRSTAVWILLSTCTCGLVLCADTDYLNNTIRDYFSDTRHHVTGIQYKQRAKEFIFSEFKRFGLDPEYNEFAIGINLATVKGYNVVGVLKGDYFGTAKDKIIGIGAHYDTVSTTKGVDDNGSGMAALLEVTKTIMAQNKNGATRKHTIIFAAWDFEEYSLAGSRIFISTWVKPWLSASYGQNANAIMPYGVFVLETIMGYNATAHAQTFPTGFENLFPGEYASVNSDNFQGDFITVIYRNKISDRDDVIAQAFEEHWGQQGRAQFEIETVALPDVWEKQQSLFGDFLRSDHANFWNDTIPALFITDSANFRGVMAACYHQECDNTETMLTDQNVAFVAKTTDTLIATIDDLSESTTGSGAIRATIGAFQIAAVLLVAFFFH